MTYGIRQWSADGTTVVYDSSLAAGGVCLGFFYVPNGGATFTFPKMAGRTGIAMWSGAGVKADIAVDSSLGYPRFVAPAGSGGATAVFFAR